MTVVLWISRISLALCAALGSYAFADQPNEGSGGEARPRPQSGASASLETRSQGAAKATFVADLPDQKGGGEMRAAEKKKNKTPAKKKAARPASNKD